MIIEFSKPLVKKTPEIYNYVDARNAFSWVYFIVDTKARQSVVVQSWIKTFIDNPSDALKKACSEITVDKDPDYTMTEILRWVKQNVKYISDVTIWKMSDKWQTPDETLTFLTGDCEDGAILMYAMAAYLQVPKNRLRLFCGDVEGGGHCWLGYRPTCYPLNWTFMDWCYWYESGTPGSRQKYYIDGVTIYDDPKNRYRKIWFAFNDENALWSLVNTYKPK